MAVVKANYVRRGVGERETAKANIRYIQERPGRDKEKLTRPLFNSSGFLGRLEAYQFIDEAAKEGRYFYRLKFSPDPSKEDTKRDLNMQKLTRQMMKRLEKRFKTTIPWAGALHDDHTDIRHVHILAALPRRLKKHELEALIREVTTLCREQRRALEPKKERSQWRETSRHERTTSHPLKFGKRFHLSLHRHAQLTPPMHHRGARPAKDQPSCTCPHCHFPQSHTGRGAHTCVSCGWTLHKKREQTLQRKGRAWERSL
jgi:hypothetical protein